MDPKTRTFFMSIECTPCLVQLSLIDITSSNKPIIFSCQNVKLSFFSFLNDLLKKINSIFRSNVKVYFESGIDGPGRCCSVRRSLHWIRVLSEQLWTCIMLSRDLRDDSRDTNRMKCRSKLVQNFEPDHWNKVWFECGQVWIFVIMRIKEGR